MFKFTWRIENFSLLLQNTGEFIDSPTFEIKSMNNVKAYVRLYPKGRLNSNYVTYYLHKTNEYQSFEFGANVKMSFTKKSKLKFEEYIIDASNASSMRLSFERDLMLEPNAFLELFLIADNIDIECVFQKPDCAVSLLPTTCCAKTTVLSDSYLFDLSLSKFDFSSFWNQRHEYSKRFIHEQSNIFLLLLKFENQFANNTLEISTVSEISTETVVCCKLSLLNSLEKSELICHRHIFKASPKNEPWKMFFDVCASAIEKFSTLRCEIVASKGNIVSDIDVGNLSTTKIISTDVPAENCRVLLKNMYDTKKFTDVVLQVGTAQFPAHKCILGNVSDVFSAMFTNNMKEEETNVVDITDIDEDIICKMLEFIYTGKIGNLDLENMAGLYSAADKYQIKELKKICMIRITESLTVDNCLEVLELAELHQDGALKDATHSFFICSSQRSVDIGQVEKFHEETFGASG